MWSYWVPSYSCLSPQVTYKHLTCAAKKLHEVLVEAGNDGVDGVARKYLQECQLMSSLRHPNITQFLGLCYLPGTQHPLLVMERLETSLDDLLENIPNLPLSLKRSVLEDVASGLLYLHDRPSPVIHRDLTASNVLLTSSLVAKISDMGNSRIIDMRGGQMARTLSKLPGTLVYMPPEALDDRHCYSPSLDVFSYGHLALFTLIQVRNHSSKLCRSINLAYLFRNFQVTFSPALSLILIILRMYEEELKLGAVRGT